MTDADVDHSTHYHVDSYIHFRYMKELEQGYVYIAQPPLYLVKRKDQGML